MTARLPLAACPERLVTSRVRLSGLPVPRRVPSCRTSEHGGRLFRRQPPKGSKSECRHQCRPAPATPRPAEPVGVPPRTTTSTCEALPWRSTPPGSGPPRGELQCQALVCPREHLSFRQHCLRLRRASSGGTSSSGATPLRAASVPAPSEEGAGRDANRVRHPATVSPPDRRPKAMVSRPLSVGPTTLRPGQPDPKDGLKVARPIGSSSSVPAPKG